MRVKLIDADFSTFELAKSLHILDLMPKKDGVYEIAVWHKNADGTEAYELVGFDFTEYGKRIGFRAERFELIDEFHPNAWLPEVEKICGDGRCEKIQFNIDLEVLFSKEYIEKNLDKDGNFHYYYP